MPCCQVSCCLNTTDLDLVETSDDLITPDNVELFHPNKRIISNEILYDYNPVGPLYLQASFWVLFIVLILVIGENYLNFKCRDVKRVEYDLGFRKETD